MISSVIASAPGSLMLFGEHAVLYGFPAIVASASVRVTVRASLRPGGRLRIHSALGQLDVPLQAAPPPPPEFRFAQPAALEGAAGILDGLEMDIASNAPATVGLGTSAAVTVAVLAATKVLRGAAPAPAPLLVTARRIVRAAQGGAGSGADVAASLWGGALYYFQDRDIPEQLPYLPGVRVVYSGYKTPTPEVIRRVAAARAAEPARFDRWFEQIGENAAQAAEAFRRGDGPAVGHLANAAHELMVALGVCDTELSAIVAALRATPGICGAKISGSGLGDCAIGFGAGGNYHGPGFPLEVSLAADGLRWEIA